MLFTHCIYDHIHIKLNNSKTDLRYFQRIDGILSIGNRASCLRGGIRGTIFFDGVLVMCMITEREFVFHHICFFSHAVCAYRGSVSLVAVLGIILYLLGVNIVVDIQMNY